LQAWIASRAWFAVGSIPIIALIVARRWLGPLSASSWLVVYGVLVLLVEHAGFTFTYTLGLSQEGFIAPPHARVDVFMAAVYATVGMIAFAILVGRLQQTGGRLAWGFCLLPLWLGDPMDAAVLAELRKFKMPALAQVPGVTIAPDCQILLFSRAGFTNGLQRVAEAEDVQLVNADEVVRVLGAPDRGQAALSHKVSTPMQEMTRSDQGL
jgi:hypothetical protein